jgi:hypothetical protein
LDAYVDFLALDREKPKERMHRNGSAQYTPASTAGAGMDGRASIPPSVQASTPPPVDVNAILVEIDRLRGLLVAASHLSAATAG